MTLPMPAWDLHVDDHCHYFDKQLLNLAQQFFSRPEGAHNTRKLRLKESTKNLIGFKRQGLTNSCRTRASKPLFGRLKPRSGHWYAPIRQHISMGFWIPCSNWAISKQYLLWSIGSAPNSDAQALLHMGVHCPT